ncbi:MAG: hypothetical protein JXA36_00140 [Coriobacteriia bacterium]|nr:hypothetical protein [Coriobacteriia bacterium]
MRRVSTVLLLLAIVLGGCANALPQGVIYPSITLDESVTEDIPIAVEFVFEGEPVAFEVTVDGSLYAGAQAAEKTVTRFGNARENDWIEDYFPAFIDEEHQETFYADLLDSLRQIRESRGLDADRYAELLVVFAQSLDYETDPVDLEPKFPVETFVDGDGDCDDKTLLLAALLSREGYDVAILLFEPEKHVALGIRSDDIAYANTDYAFTETTAEGFIGMVPDEFAGGITLSSEPRVFRIGSGTTPYAAGAQVAAILDARERALAQAEDLTDEIAAADAELSVLAAEVSASDARLSALKSAGRIDEYNALIPEHNELVRRYNSAAEDRNELADRYNVLAGIDSLVVNGLDDRAGTYAAITAAID